MVMILVHTNDNITPRMVESALTAMHPGKFFLAEPVEFPDHNPSDEGMSAEETQIRRVLHHLKETGEYCSERYEYADNWRCANIDNPSEVMVYATKMRTGCCGSREMVVEFDGATYLFGFNYGH